MLTIVSIFTKGRSFDVNYLEKIERIATRERGYKSLRKFQNEESLPLLPFFGIVFYFIFLIIYYYFFVNIKQLTKKQFSIAKE